MTRHNHGYRALQVRVDGLLQMCSCVATRDVIEDGINLSLLNDNKMATAAWQPRFAPTAHVLETVEARGIETLISDTGSERLSPWLIGAS